MAKLHTVRTRSQGLLKLSITRGKAIKLMCTECMGWGEEHPKNCTSYKCPLFPFRGKSMASIFEQKGS